MTKPLTLLALTIVALAADTYKILTKIQIGGTGGWDYVAMDTPSRHLFVSHGTRVHIVDVDTGKVLAAITDLHGVHGIAIAAEFNKGFISNGQSNTVTVFDLTTFAKSAEIPAGTNPDAICYEPKTKRVFTFNGRSNDSTAIDAATNAVVATFPVGPKPEFCAADGAGRLYANIESAAEIVEIDAAKPAVTRRASLKPCEEPSGLAIDPKHGKLFSACDNQMMAVTDTKTMKVIATPAIGNGPDAAGFDPGPGLAFSSNGRDGTLTVVKLVGGKYQPIATVPTERGARTMAVDTKTHRIYLLAAKYGPTPEAKEGQRPARPPILPDTFHVLVVGK